MLVLHQLPYVLSMLRCTFYAFSGTNLLTRCHSASSCFLLFLVSEILHRKYSRNWTGQKTEIIYLPWQHRRPRGSRRHAAGRPHPCQARPRAGPHLAWCGPPGHRLTPPFRLFNPRHGYTLSTRAQFHENHRHHRSTLVREGF